VLKVVAAVIERGERVLICRRRATDRHPLKWEFPGGKVERGEDPAAALARELEEELAIQAAIGPEIIRYEFRYGQRPSILLIFYHVVDFRGEPANLQFEEIRWETRQRLPLYDFLEGDVDFVRQLARGSLAPTGE
jgi:8-oxo-dGTP diphosphatase